MWVFHGPHQRDVEQRFASFGSDATAVPISKTGKNALDFHLSFYMGYIASRNPGAVMVVIANDKGYEPMLEHARTMGFAVRRVAHGKAAPEVKRPAAKKVAAKKAPIPAAKKATAKAVLAPVAVPAVPVPAPDSPATIRRLTQNLRKMGDKRPTKAASLWRSLKSFLGKDATEDAVEVVLARLIAEGVLKGDSVKGASYPKFDPAMASAAVRV